MSSEENLRGVLSTDLIFEILSRLPAKSVARCRCLSKLWASLLSSASPYFTELFLTHSKTRPRLLFAVKINMLEWYLYSCPQPQISSTNSKSSISVTAEFHMSLTSASWIVHISPSISGLMYFYNIRDRNSRAVCNPSTRQLFWLPLLTVAEQSYFGYDPNKKQFSVLAINDPFPSRQVYRILNLRSGKLSWRSLKCPLRHYPSETSICINGVLYYMVWIMSTPYSHAIANFDLNSEEFKFIDIPWSREHDLLVNFKGKLAGINAKWVESSTKGFHLQLSLWILEDADKQEWSKHVYDILQTELWNKNMEPYCIVGMTSMGDIVLTLRYTTNPFYVYFFNLEKKTLQKVEIKGFEGFKRRNFFGCVDYVEELRALKWN